jgi:hypothetical protein
MIINVLVTYLSVDQLPDQPARADAGAQPQRWQSRWWIRWL